MKYALRQLAKNPGFTVVALLTLALGIGVNTTAFTVLNRLLLQSLPYRDPGTLVQVWARTPQADRTGHAPGDFFDEQEQNTVFSAMAAYIPGSSISFAEPGQPAVQAGSVEGTANFFSVLGVEPQIGRLPSADEEARFVPVTLLSNRFWRQHYNADRGVLGRTVRLAGKGYTVIGVMPAAVDDQLLFDVPADFFPLNPMRLNRDLRGTGWYTVVARLKPGVSLTQAQAAMNVLAARFTKDHPRTNTGRTFELIPFPTSDVDRTASELTWMTLGLSGLVLLIACVNLANLQLVRTSRRGQEIGIRLALGCSRVQVIRMLVLESVLLAVGGGLLGLLVAIWSNAYVEHYFSITMPLDLRVIGFAFLVALLTGILFGTFPAWLASRTDINSSLKSAGRGATSSRSRHWLRQSLVVVELSMALTLLAGAGFFVGGIYRLTHRQLNWDPTHELVGFIELDHDHFGERLDPRSLVFSDRLRAALGALPGVEMVAVSHGSPAGGDPSAPYRVEGRPPPEKGSELYAGNVVCSPGYFKLFGIRLIAGRDFRESDNLKAAPVAIINEKMARKLWPGQDPIGKRIGDIDPANPNWAQVVGVVADYEAAGQFYDRSGDGLMFAVPWARHNHRFIVFSVRTTGDPAALREQVRKAVGLLAPDLALNNLDTVDEIMASELSYFSFLRRVLVEIAALGLLLSAVGIYGVVANLAAERTKEIGIRMALGAQAGSLVWLFLKSGLQLAAIGATLGVGAAYALVVILSRMVPEVPGRDPRVIAGVAFVLVAVALLACWIPARRTTRISPTVALRTE